MSVILLGHDKAEKLARRKAEDDARRQQAEAAIRRAEEDAKMQAKLRIVPKPPTVGFSLHKDSGWGDQDLGVRSP